MEDSNLIATSILHRIALYERANAQVEFLRILNNSPLRNSLVLRGSAAIYGAYLNSHRFAKDLDFLAPLEVSHVFHACPEESGLPVQRIKNNEGELVPVFVGQGTVYERVFVGIDVCVDGRREHPYNTRPFHTPTRQSVTTRVQILEEIVAEKLDAASQRCKATDFFDLWLILRQYTDLKERVRAVLAQRPRAIVHFDLEATLHNLHQARSTWEETLQPVTLKVPAYKEVADALEVRLLEFDR